MLADALTTLAAAGGSAAVGAMATDAWASTKASLARLLGRDDPQRTALIEDRLEASRAELSALSGSGLEQARAEHEVAWRSRLADLLEESPDLGGQLAMIIEEVRRHAQSQALPGQVQQILTAEGNARQAAQGHGLQVNVFGSTGRVQ